MPSTRPAFAFIREHLDAVCSRLGKVGLELAAGAYLFSNDPAHAVPWNPDWASHKISNLAGEAWVDLNIKKLRHYTASQLLAARFDLQNTAARLGHGGGATTLKHYATRSPRSTANRQAAAYPAELTGAAAVLRARPVMTAGRAVRPGRMPPKAQIRQQLADRLPLLVVPGNIRRCHGPVWPEVALPDHRQGKGSLELFDLGHEPEVAWCTAPGKPT